MGAVFFPCCSLAREKSAEGGRGFLKRLRDCGVPVFLGSALSLVSRQCIPAIFL